MQSKKESRKEICSLTIFRGVAALLVVLYHIKDRLSIYLPEYAHEIVSRGYLAVDFFFILSGFVLALSYGDFFSDKGNENRFFIFVVKRIARLYPLHLFVLACYLLIPILRLITGREASSSQFDFNLLLANIFLVQNWGWTERLSWNIPAWSISTEMFAYMLFPLLLSLLRIFRNQFLLLPFSVCYLAILSVFMMHGYSTIDADIPSLGVFRCVLEFSMGVCLYYINKQFGIAATLGMTFVTILFLFFCFFYSDLSAEIVLIPLFFSVIILWAVYFEFKSDLSRAAVLMWLGKVSYSVYLCHYFLRDIFKLLLPEGATPIWWILLYLLSVFVCAHFLYKNIESKSKKVEVFLFRLLSKLNIHLVK